MKNINLYGGSKGSVRKSIKNRNLDKGILLQSMFHLNYAGKANIFIDYNKITRKYKLVIQGVHIVEDVFCFSENYIKRYEFESLYYAIRGFQIVNNILMSNMDWYDPDLFATSNVYDEIFLED